MLSGNFLNLADECENVIRLTGSYQDYIRTISFINKENKIIPGIVLFTDDQLLLLQDVISYCTSGCTVLGVDRTYNVCDMYVIPTVYKNLSVNMKKTSIKSYQRWSHIYTWKGNNTHILYLFLCVGRSFA